MSNDWKPPVRGENWWIAWSTNKGEDAATFHFDNDTVLDSEVMDVIRKHRAWHLYCDSMWSGGDLSVFKPVADIVKKISVYVEKGEKIVGLNCLANLEMLSVSDDVSLVDFTKFTKLRSLKINERSKGGNWRLCESLEDLFLDVPTANLTKLGALRNLRSLALGRGLKSFEGIGNLPALRELRIGGCHLASLESLGDLPELRLLLVNLMPKLESLKGIAGLPNLENLEVTQCGRLRDVSAISALNRLKKLELAFCPLINSLRDVRFPEDCKVVFVPKGKVGDGF